MKTKGLKSDLSKLTMAAVRRRVKMVLNPTIMVSARRFSEIVLAVFAAMLMLQLASDPVSASLRVPTRICDAKTWNDAATDSVWDWTVSTPTSTAPTAPADPDPQPQEPDHVFNLWVGPDGGMGVASQGQTVTSASVASVLNQLSIWQFVPALQESSVCREDLPPPDPPVAELLKVPILRIAI